MTVQTELFAFLDRHAAAYRVITHAAGTDTLDASRLRGHHARQAAKCIVVQVRKGKRGRRYVLAVVPGDCRVDFSRIRDLYGASDVSFAPLAVAEGLAGSSSGTFMPFTFHADLELLVDSALTGAGEIYFNAARAELSIAMAVPTYLALTSPRIADIAAAYAEVHP